MNVIVSIPDDLAARLMTDGADLSRQALEAIAADGYRAGHLNKPDLRRLLGFETGDELDGFLKDHGVFETYTPADLDRERQTLRRLGY